MLDEFGIHMVTATAKLKFLHELVVLVDSLLTRIGRKSCTFTERMLHVDTKEVHVTYETTEVFFDPQRGKTKINRNAGLNQVGA
jgi:acyl-CoA thioester hydrolase